MWNWFMFEPQIWHYRMGSAESGLKDMGRGWGWTSLQNSNELL